MIIKALFDNFFFSFWFYVSETYTFPCFLKTYVDSKIFQKRLFLVWFGFWKHVLEVGNKERKQWVELVNLIFKIRKPKTKLLPKGSQVYHSSSNM